MKKTQAQKSLFEFITEAIDEALPADSAVTGHEVYMRGWEKFEQYCFEKDLARKRRELEKAAPLLTAKSLSHD